MRILLAIRRLTATTVVGGGLLWAAPAAALPLIVNGGFEAGLAGWTVVDAPGGDGTFFVQTGAQSPVGGDPVPVPPGGLAAAMSDAFGPGTHVLYQDFVVPTGVASARLSFDLFIGNRAGMFFIPSPPTLMFDIPDLNQQARIDILRAGTDPFSLAPADVLLNVLQTLPGSPPMTGYTPLALDLTALLMANTGQALRLRFAEVDNVFTFQLGVDNVSVEAQLVPEPATGLLVATGVAVIVGSRRRRRRRRPPGATTNPGDRTLSLPVPRKGRGLAATRVIPARGATVPSRW